jgi:hypothetical protein
LLNPSLGLVQKLLAALLSFSSSGMKYMRPERVGPSPRLVVQQIDVHLNPTFEMRRLE